VKVKTKNFFILLLLTFLIAYIVSHDQMEIIEVLAWE